MIYTLNPHRSLIEQMNVSTNGEPAYRLSEERAREIESQILVALQTGRFYLDTHFSATGLSRKLRLNKNYISEALNRGQYGSFYNLINTLCLNEALRLMQENPAYKLEEIAISCGFSSGSSFSQIFKRFKGVNPSDWSKTASASPEKPRARE